MAGNTQMNENERGIFKLHGITGMLIAVVLFKSLLAMALNFSICRVSNCLWPVYLYPWLLNGAHISILENEPKSLVSQPFFCRNFFS